jgi:hypothetical protein
MSGSKLGFLVGLLVATLLFLGVAISIEGSVGEAAVAVGTLALAFSTIWLALEARAERGALREQHQETLRAVREAEQRRWALELRRILLQFEDATLEYEVRTHQAAKAFEATNPGAYATARVEARRPWVETLGKLQLDLGDYIDLVSMVDESTRLAMLRGFSIAVENTEIARTSKEVIEATGQLLNVTADLVDAISKGLAIPSIRRVQRRTDVT